MMAQSALESTGHTKVVFAVVEFSVEVARVLDVVPSGKAESRRAKPGQQGAASQAIAP